MAVAYSDIGICHDFGEIKIFKFSVKKLKVHTLQQKLVYLIQRKDVIYKNIEPKEYLSLVQLYNQTLISRERNTSDSLFLLTTF